MSTALAGGVFVGCLYGLFAVGLVVVYRGSRTITFAHGETGMIGALLFAELAGEGGVHPVVALVAGVVTCTLIGGATEVLLVRPLRNQPRINVMIGTFAVAGLLLVFALQRWGAQPRRIEPLVSGEGFELAGLRISPQQALVLVSSVALLVALHLLFTRSTFGLRLRAVAIDAVTAGQLGVNIDRISLAAWALAGAVAGTSAILMGGLLVSVHPLFMTSFMIRGLTAALVGGLVNLWTVFASGLALGVLEGFISYRSSTPGIVEVGLAVFVLFLLLIRPGGLVRVAY
jgi:branched-subunit amino acid ABC-type transport system permease component